MKNIIFITILFSFCSCKSQNLIQGYDLAKPSKFVKLPSELNEISGLQYYNNRHMMAVQDEEAILFKIKTATGTIVQRKKFGNKGDYEGVTQVGKTYYVLRSDGTLFEICDKEIIKKHEFKHNKHMDFEGVCFDKTKNRLLVACKENLHKGSKKEVFIYSFNLEKKDYKKKPFLKIDKKKVHKNFKPSAIAIHPNGNIYVLSSFSKTLLVLNSKGKKIEQTQLSEYIFHQPEGIAFDKDGTLYISNEKHDTYPTLLKFEQHAKK